MADDTDERRRRHDAALSWSAERIPSLLQGIVDLLHRRRLSVDVLAGVEREVGLRRAKKRIESERKERSAADLLVDIEYCRLTVAQRNAQMGYIGASVLDSLHDSTLNLTFDQNPDQDAMADSLILEMQSSAASSDYFLTKPLDAGAPAEATTEATELARQNAVLRRLLRSLRLEEESLSASAAEELERALRIGEDQEEEQDQEEEEEEEEGNEVRGEESAWPHSSSRRWRWRDGGVLALPQRLANQSDVPVNAWSSLPKPTPHTLAPLVLPASRPPNKLGAGLGNIPPSPLDTAPCNLKVVPPSSKRSKPRPALVEQQSEASSSAGPAVESPHPHNSATAARLNKRARQEAEARALKRLLLLSKAEDEMKKIDKAEREAAKRRGQQIEGMQAEPPRVRLVSTPLTLPELDAEQTERVARKAITKMRIKISGGRVAFVTRPYSRVETMLLENPFATPLVEKYQKLVDKAQKERRMEEIRRLALDSTKK